MAETFEVVRHDCASPAPVLMEALMTGVARVRCPGCKQRVWIVSDGERVRTTLVDSAPEKVVE